VPENRRQGESRPRIFDLGKACCARPASVGIGVNMRVCRQRRLTRTSATANGLPIRSGAPLRVRSVLLRACTITSFCLCGYLGSFFPVARGTGTRTASLAGAWRHRPGDQPDRPDDSPDVPTCALPSCSHCPGRGDPRPPLRIPLHARPRVGRAPQRAHCRSGLAGPRRAAGTLRRGDRHHPGASWGHPHELSRPILSARQCAPFRSPGKQGPDRDRHGRTARRTAGRREG
jgi:hypothetical protein